MATETVNAWFLHKRLSGDTSCRVTFYTLEHGMIHALYKGGRTPKKQALLQPFTSLWVMFDIKYDWYYVRQLELESVSLPRSGHILFSSLYINELVYRTVKPNDPAPVLYTAYVEALHQLNQVSNSVDIEPILRRFERVLLQTLGYDLLLTHEATSGHSIEALSYYDFIPQLGFVKSVKGLYGGHIKAFAEGKLDCADVRKTAKWIMRKAIDHILDGKPLHSREYMKLRS